MKKLSIQKFSALGIVLMAASAVTAAIIPSNSKADASRFAAGNLTASQNNGGVSPFVGLTCKPGGSGAACIDTLTGAASGDTGVAGNATRSNATTD